MPQQGKMDLKEISCEDWDWIHLSQDKVQWYEHGNEHLGFVKRGKFLDQLNYYRILKKDSTVLSCYLFRSIYKIV